MSAIYRSYEVPVEETAENHKTRGAGKTKKEFKSHHENTNRALRVTHELFQDVVRTILSYFQERPKSRINFIACRARSRL
jgi:bisphosphoglycerate-dependent phosphoglycerate mutase